MLRKTVALVTRQLEKYGVRAPFVEIGAKDARPFTHIDPHYISLNPENGAPPIESLSSVFKDNFGTAVACGVLERVSNPFAFFDELYRVMKHGAVAVVESAFSSPYVPGAKDLWRFSPDSLKLMAEKSGFKILECDWNLEEPSEGGVKSAYVTLVKGDLSAIPVRTLEPQARIEAAPRPSLSVKPEKQVPRKCVFLDTVYDRFLTAHYSANPALMQAPSKQQTESIIRSNFGDSDYYSGGLRAQGWDAENLIVNCAPLQKAWAAENGSSKSGFDLVVEQVRKAAPDVLYIQDMHLFSEDFLRAVRPFVKLIVGQIASSPRNLPFRSYDIVLSSIGPFVDYFRSLGVASYWQPLAFEKRLAASFGTADYESRPVEVSFVGGLNSGVHSERFQFLEKLAAELPINFWGYGIDSLPAESPIRARYRGEAWGEDMFRVLSSSKITFNIHAQHTLDDPAAGLNDAPVARHFANNMRLYEATGCGALLVTDHKDNLNELFKIGEEVVAYRSADECIALIKYYLQNPREAARIARAGRERTLQTHAYARRMEHTAEILDRHLRYKAKESEPAPDLSKISYGHSNIGTGPVEKRLTEGWKSAEIPKQQRGLVQQELRTLFSGGHVTPFMALAALVRSHVRAGDKVLEIGCSSGYYYEVLEYLLKKRIAYTGVDYSAAMIEMAREYYPQAEFQAADGAKLPFPERSFDLAISGCILLHVPNYPEHIQETVRVAKRYIAAHRTPVSRLRPLQQLKKFAYGVETVELRFNEKEFVQEFLTRGCRLIKVLEVESNPANDEYTVSYLFERHTE